MGSEPWLLTPDLTGLCDHGDVIQNTDPAIAPPIKVGRTRWEAVSAPEPPCRLQAPCASVSASISLHLHALEL